MSKNNAQDYLLSKGIKEENRIVMIPIIESTGLNSPQATEITTLINVYYNMDRFDEEVTRRDFSKIKEGNKEYIYHSKILYDLCKPTKSIEPMASKITGIRDEDLAKGVPFKDSKLAAMYMKGITKGNIEIRFANSYAMNLFNEELKRSNLPPLYEFDNNELLFKFNHNYKITVMDSHAMRFMHNKMPTYSFDNIIKTTESMGFPRDTEHEEFVLKVFENLYPNRLKNADISAKDALNVNHAIDVIGMVNPEIYQNDYERGNIPLEVFPFRRVGKQIISKLEDVSLYHLFNILAKTDSSKGVATLATLRETIVRNYNGDNFKQKALDFITQAKNQELYNEDSDAYSEMFEKFVVSIEKEAQSHEVIKEKKQDDAKKTYNSITPLSALHALRKEVENDLKTVEF